MAERVTRYPLLRARRRRWRWRVPVRFVRLALVAGVSLLIVATLVHLARQAEKPDPQAELALSAKLLAAGNYNAARARAQSAIAVRPDMAAAYLALARAYARLGDGIGAEGAVAQARAKGVPAAETHGLMAEADRLQDDPDGARDEAANAPAADREAARAAARAMADDGDYPAAVRGLRALLATDDRDSLTWSALGRVWLASGDMAGAGEAAARAIAIDGANLDALVLRGETVRSQYGLEASLPWFRAALAHDAYYHPALIAYAATLGDLGRNREMLAAARDAMAAVPGSTQALYLQAVLAARAGRWSLARALLDKTGGQDDAMPGVMLLSGAVDYARGVDGQAVTTLRNLVAQQPMNLVARRLAGAALLRSGDPRGALAMLRPIALRDDADAYTLTLAARAFEATGERDWAARFLDRAADPGLAPGTPFGSDDDVATQASAVADAPDDPAAAADYIRALLDDGNGAAALARAQAIADASPGAPQAQLLVGDTLAGAGRWADAARAYARAAGLRFDAPALLRLVEARGRTGDTSGAAQALALYLGQNPQSLVARRLAANAQMAAGDWDAAIATLRSLLVQIGPRDAGLLADLARAYTEVDDPARALACARAAYALQPMNAGVADAFGWAAYQADRDAEARQLLAKAATLAPRSSLVRWHQAQMLADAHRDAEARAALAVVLADPHFADRDAAMALAAALR